MYLFTLFCIVLCVQAFVPHSDILRIPTDEAPCGIEASPNLIHQNSWLVFLEYFDGRGSELSIRCGATLFSKRHLITAAHCVKIGLFHRLIARLGEYDLNTAQDCSGSVCADPVVRIGVKKVIIAPGYSGSENDMAILELEKDAPYTDFIRPICFPTHHQAKVMFTAAGWGETSDNHIYTHVKKIIPLPSWTNEDCRKVYMHLKLPEKIICAGGEEGVDTCRGDSGGPLMLNNGRIELWGVTSSGNVKCGTMGSPGRAYAAPPVGLRTVPLALDPCLFVVKTVFA